MKKTPGLYKQDKKVAENFIQWRAQKKPPAPSVKEKATSIPLERSNDKDWRPINDEHMPYALGTFRPVIYFRKSPLTAPWWSYIVFPQEEEGSGPPVS